jgi:hypothetical protein
MQDAEGKMPGTSREIHTTDPPLMLITPRPHRRAGIRIAATTDPELIKAWAALHGAQPATGQATRSGAATIDVNDGGAGIRFNFPGFARLRPIPWDEWLDNFERHDLLFVYEEQDREEVAARAYSLWQRHGGGDGHDHDDWFEAERELQRDAGGDTPSVRYWIVKNQPT